MVLVATAIQLNVKNMKSVVYLTLCSTLTVCAPTIPFLSIIFPSSLKMMCNEPNWYLFLEIPGEFRKRYLWLTVIL